MLKARNVAGQFHLQTKGGGRLEWQLVESTVLESKFFSNCCVQTLSSCYIHELTMHFEGFADERSAEWLVDAGPSVIAHGIPGLKSHLENNTESMITLFSPQIMNSFNILQTDLCPICPCSHHELHWRDKPCLDHPTWVTHTPKPFAFCRHIRIRIRIRVPETRVWSFLPV